jgi:threonine/homoserine/homoserine lactone efflux protein
LRNHRIFQLLELFTTALILALAAGSFIAAYKTTGFNGSIPIGKSLDPFWTGVILSATNPLHIPFWLGWSTVLLNKKILLPNANHYNWYITGIAIGTILGFMVFIYGGNYMVGQITRHQNILNLAIGSVLLLTAIIQLKKIVTVPAAVRYGRKL